MTEQGGERYLTAKEASAYIGITRRTLDRHVSEGRIKKYRQGLQRVVFKQSDVEALKQRLESIQPEEDK
jgi:excisionase family DNA binding protein